MRLNRSLLAKKDWIVFRLPEAWRYPSNIDNQQLSWTWANEKDIDLFFGMDSDRTREFNEFLKKKSIGVFSSYKGKWVSYAWLKLPGDIGPYHLPRSVKKLKVHWIFYCRTKEEYQRRGIYRQSLCKLSEWARKKDPNAEIYIDTEPSNISSRKAILSVGFKPYGVIRTIVLGCTRLGRHCFGVWQRSVQHEDIPIN